MSHISQGELHMQPVMHMTHAEQMRRIRNSVAQFMTHNSEQIAYQQQFKWYEDTYRPANERGEMAAFLAEVNGEAVGYGMIQTIDEKKWVTGAITKAVRGEGYGRQLFSQLTDMVHETEDEVWLDVARGNERAQNLYRSLGYRTVRDTAEVIIMVHKQEGDLAA